MQRLLKNTLTVGLVMQGLIPSTALGENLAKLKNPVPNTVESISKGQLLFAQNCTNCHGEDGRSQIEMIAVATDLTSPEMYYSGTSEGEIFQSIREGAGVAMPQFSFKFADEEIWHLVNFVLNLWPADQRPEIVD